MISTLLIHPELHYLHFLEERLKTYCPRLDIKAKLLTEKGIRDFFKSNPPDLIFIEWSMVARGNGYTEKQEKIDFETIILTEHQSEDFTDLNTHKSLLRLDKTLNPKEFLPVVNYIQSVIEIKRERREIKKTLTEILRVTPPNDIFSIPTIEGFEFLKVNEILRCEGLQKYTRIITLEKSDIISSYSIGQFCEILVDYGFFHIHKSHLVNLRHLRKFLLEGTVIMRDGSMVPVARRKRKAFIERVNNFNLYRSC